MAMYYPFLGSGRTLNQITTPLVYDESLSVAQQIACIMGKINSIDTDYVGTDEFEAFKQQLAALLDQLFANSKAYTDTEIKNLDVSLRALIEQIEEGSLQWDVTQGEYTDSVTAMRDMFNDLTVHAITVDTLAGMDMDVDGLANCGLNVRGLAVFSGYLIGEDFSPEGIMYQAIAPDANITCAVLKNAVVKDGYLMEG